MTQKPSPALQQYEPPRLFAAGMRRSPEARRWRASERTAAVDDYRAGREPRWNASLTYLHEYDRQKRLHITPGWYEPARRDA